MHSSPAKAQANRVPLLDCIRAGAVFGVILYHLAGDVPIRDPVANWFAWRGLLGVDIFFPLSGYLITSFLLNRHSGRDVGVFFLRRVFRIVPLYMAALAVFAAGSLLLGETEGVATLWKNALFLTGWSIFHEGRSEVVYTITWSLSVEEFAYIIVGLGALFLKGRLGGLLLAMAVFSIALRFWINASGMPDVYFYPPARLDSVALGGLTAWAMHRGLPVLWPLVSLAVVAQVVLQLGRVPFHTTIYLQIAILTCILIRVITLLPRVDVAPVRAVASFGFYSYFIYLFHYFNIAIVDVVQERFDLWLAFWPMAAVVTAMTYVQAWLSYRYFEGPMMGLGRRLEGRIGRTGDRPPPTKAEVPKPEQAQS